MMVYHFTCVSLIYAGCIDEISLYSQVSHLMMNTIYVLHVNILMIKK